MTKIRHLLTGALFFMALTLACTEKESTERVVVEPRIYDGLLEIVSEPRMEDPCMPGMVFSLSLCEDSNLIIVQDGHFIRWHSNNTAVDRFGVEIGDSLSLNGICEEIVDLNNKKHLILKLQ